MREMWAPKPGDRVVRHPREDEISPVRLTVTARRVPPRALSYPLILMYGFTGLIAIGTIILLMPFSQNAGGFTPFVTAMFTSASAVTLTGLVIQDTATYWTRSGQVTILALMFIGGLGFMTTATFLLVLIGQRMNLTQRLRVREGLSITQLGGLARITVGIVLVSVLVQILGFFALLGRFLNLFSPAEAVWQAAFHAVSGYNNAGFVALTTPGGLDRFRTDEAVLGTIAVLAVIGGIGYWVLLDVFKSRRFSAFTLNTKLVLITTLALLLIGAAVFFAFEYDNPGTIDSLSVREKAAVSAFQSVTSRTAGFTVIDYGEAKEHTNFFFASLMVIGGASASVAGGIKVNTLAIVLVAILSTVRGRSHASAFGREIPIGQVKRAMAIGAVATVSVFFLSLLLTVSEGGFEFIDLLFESVSAFGTVGLSTGVTPDLSSSGHLILIATMLIGRLGPLSVAVAMAQSNDPDLYRYPEERVTIG